MNSHKNHCKKYLAEEERRVRRRLEPRRNAASVDAKAEEEKEEEGVLAAEGVPTAGEEAKAEEEVPVGVPAEEEEAEAEEEVPVAGGVPAEEEEAEAEEEDVEEEGRGGEKDEEDEVDPEGRTIPSLLAVSELLEKYNTLKAADVRMGQRRAAKLLGCSQSMLSRYLKKEKKLATTDNLHKKKDVPHKIAKTWDEDLKQLERHIYHKVKRMCDQRSDGLDPDTFPAVAEAVAEKKDLQWRDWKYPNGIPFTFSAAWMKAFNKRYDVKAEYTQGCPKVGVRSKEKSHF